MKQSSDIRLISELKSKLIFGNSNGADPIVALAVIDTSDTRVFIQKSEMDRFDPSVMSLDISAISSIEQFTLAIAEIKFCAARGNQDDLQRIDDLTCMMEDYATEETYSD